MEVDFKPAENFLDKEKYKDQTIEFTIEDFFTKENKEGKLEYRLILNNTSGPSENEDMRSNNKINVALQQKFGTDTEKWKNQRVNIKFFDFVQDGEVKGITAEIV